MLVSKDIINDLYNNISEEKLKLAKKYNDENKIKIIKATYDDNKNFELHAKANGHRDTHDIFVKALKNEIVDVKCTCKEYKSTYESCSHIIATILKFANSTEYSNIFEKQDKKDTRFYDRTNKYKTFNQIINTFYDELCAQEQETKTSAKITTDLIEIEPKIIYDTQNKEMSVEFKLGNGKNSYKIKNLITFYDTFSNKGTFKYGQKLEFKHTRSIFRNKDLKLLDFLLKYSEIIKYTNESIGQQRYYGKVMNESSIIISNTCLDEMFDVFDGEYIKIKKDYNDSESKTTNLYYDKVSQDFFVNKTQVHEEYSMPQEKVVPPDEARTPSIFEETVIEEKQQAESPEKIEEKTAFPDLEYLAQLHATYLLCQAQDGLYIIDQHAAQERIKYEYWRDKIGEVSMDQQILLAPYIFSLPKNDFLMFLDRKSILEEAGLFLEEYGENQLILREHPTWLQENDLEETVYEMIDEILLTKEFSVKKYRHDLATMVACKSSIKANHPLDVESARALVKELATCENPYSCAHGRPTIVHFNGGDLEKMFRRRQETHLSKAASWKNIN